MTAPRWVYAALLACLAGMLVAGFAAHERQIGAARLEAKQAKADEAKWRKIAAQRDTVVVVKRDTLRLVRQRTDTVLALTTDTVIKTEVVRELVRNERAACDSVITAVQSVCAAKDSQIAALNRRIAAEIKQRPGFFQRNSGKALAAALGFLIGRASK